MLLRHHLLVIDRFSFLIDVGGGISYANERTPYPDGTMFTDDVRDFLAVDGIYLQVAARMDITLMVKDSKKYASTGGWGFGRFIDGEPVDKAQHETCFACHQANVKGHDFVFTRFAR